MSDAELLKYDTRARERLLRSGAITAEQVRAYVESLPDSADRCDQASVDQPALHRAESERAAAPPPARTIEAAPRVTTEGSDPARASAEATPGIATPSIVESDTATPPEAQAAPAEVAPEPETPGLAAAPGGAPASPEPATTEPSLPEPAPPTNPEEPS